MDDRRYPLLFITNPHAGTRRFDVAAAAKATIGPDGWDLVETREPGHAVELARNAATEGFGAVVGVGGDGTLNEVARGLQGTGTALGVVPRGSGNAFARYFRVSRNPGRACRVLRDGVIRRIDLGRVGSDVMLTTAGTGLDAVVCHAFNARAGGRRGLIPYVSSTFGALRSFQPEPVTLVTDDGARHDARPFLLAVANTREFGYGATIAPDAEPDDGLLDVCIVEDMTLWRAAFSAHRLYTGTFGKTPGVTYLRTGSLEVEREGPGLLQVDGEARTYRDGLTFTVLPRALSVIVPAE